MHLDTREKQFEKIHGKPEEMFYFNKIYYSYPYCYYDMETNLEYRGQTYKNNLEIDIFICLRHDVKYEDVAFFAIITGNKGKIRLDTSKILLLENVNYPDDKQHYIDISKDIIIKLLYKKIAVEYFLTKVNEIQKLYNKGYEFKDKFDTLMFEINETENVCFYDMIQDQLSPDYRDFILHYSNTEPFDRKLIKYIDNIHGAIMYIDARI